MSVYVCVGRPTPAVHACQVAPLQAQRQPDRRTCTTHRSINHWISQSSNHSINRSSINPSIHPSVNQSIHRLSRAYVHEVMNRATRRATGPITNLPNGWQLTDFWGFDLHICIICVCMCLHIILHIWWSGLTYCQCAWGWRGAARGPQPTTGRPRHAGSPASHAIQHGQIVSVRAVGSTDESHYGDWARRVPL